MTAVDVVVVGGGPIGLASAIALRQRGLSVRLFEQRRPPIDKACGEGLMPEGVAMLSRLGVEILADHRWPLRGISFSEEQRGTRDRSQTITGSFPEGWEGWGIRRPVLQQALASRAAEVGVDLRWEERVLDVSASSTEEAATVRTATGSTTTRFVVAADGLLSARRQAAGLSVALSSRRVQRFGVRRHFAVAPWSDGVEVRFGSKSEAYVTPVAAGLVGVALLWTRPRGTPHGGGVDACEPPPGTVFDRLLADHPSLQVQLAGLLPASQDAGRGPFEQPVRSPIAGRLALVGDAAGYVDAITGEGVTLGLRQAVALADSIAATGGLEAYRRAYWHLWRRPRLFLGGMLFLQSHPRWRRFVAAALHRQPRLINRLLAIHGGCGEVA